MLTDDLLEKIRKIVEKHHTTIAIGFKDDVELAYLYGQILAESNDPKIHEMSLKELEKHLQKNPIQLSEVEQKAKEAAKTSAGQYIKNLASSVVTWTTTNVAQASQQLLSSIRSGVVENVANRETLSQLTSDLSHASDDWNRNWKRVAVTEKQAAMNRGQMDYIVEHHGMEAKVFKRPAPDACEHCKRLHLESDGVTPKVFSMEELEGNGSNHGRKVAEWEPTVGPVHPNCGCPLQRLPPHFGFDEEGNMMPLAAMKTEKSDRLVIPLKKAGLHSHIANAHPRNVRVRGPGTSGANMETGVKYPDRERQQAPSTMMEFMRDWLAEKTDDPQFYERPIEDYFVIEPFVPEHTIVKPEAYVQAEEQTQELAEETKEDIERRQRERFGNLSNEVLEMTPQDP